MLKMLIAVDGSDLSLDAVRHALRLKAEGLDAQLVLANVQEPPSLYEMITVRDPDRLAGLGAGAGEHLLQAARQLCDASGADYEFEVASGEPAHTLVEMAERHGCDAILAGVRGKGGSLGGGWLGSVSQELMHVSTVPVTLVKHPDTPMPAAEDSDDQASAQAQPFTAEREPEPLQGLA
ncbi:MAG TPA: universal stress protein [Ramlibacter sp.]|nr:universal stress protein [Ramlibacter sp.]